VTTPHIGTYIRQAREQLGMTQEELAERVQKDQRSISEYENGRRRLAAADLPSFAEALGVSVLYFYGHQVSDEDYVVALLAQFDRLPTSEAKRSAIELLTVFSDALEEGTP